MNNQTVAVLVAAYNEAGIIQKTLKSIASQRGDGSTTFAIHVLANGCTDNTVELARATIADLSERPDMTFQVHNLKQPSKIKALNFGLQRTHAPLIFSVDADSVLSSNCFIETLELFEDPATMVGGPLPQLVVGRKHCDALLGQLQRTANICNRYYECTTPGGCMIAWRRELAPEFPTDIAADDTWLAFRAAHQHGWNSVKVTRTAEVHVVGPQQWLDYIKQESRFARVTRQLLEVFPEFAQVRAQQMEVVKELAQKHLQVVKHQLRRENIRVKCLKYRTFFQDVCDENSLLMADQLLGADNRWEAIMTTKRTPEELC